jgi:hypothetical protein
VIAAAAAVADCDSEDDHAYALAEQALRWAITREAAHRACSKAAKTRWGRVSREQRSMLAHDLAMIRWERVRARTHPGGVHRGGESGECDQGEGKAGADSKHTGQHGPRRQGPVRQGEQARGAIPSRGVGQSRGAPEDVRDLTREVAGSQRRGDHAAGEAIAGGGAGGQRAGSRDGGSSGPCGTAPVRARAGARRGDHA